MRIVVPAIFADRRFIAASVLVLSVYVVSLAATPRRVFWGPDEGAKWMVMHSTRLEGGLDLRYSVDFPAQRIDSEYAYLPTEFLFPRPTIAANGDLFLGFETPVIFPLISAIPFRLFGVIGVYFLPLVSGWLMAILAGVLAEAVRPGIGAVTVLTTGLATPVLFYSTLFWEHTAAGLLGLAAVAVVALSRPWSLAALLASIVCLLGATTMRVEMLALGAAVLIAWSLCGWATPGPTVAQRRFAVLQRWSIPGWAVVGALAVGMLGAGVFLEAVLTIRHRDLLEDLPGRIVRGFSDLSPWSFLDVFIHRSSVSGAPYVQDTWVVAAGIGALFCVAAAFAGRAAVEWRLLVVGSGAVLWLSLSLLTNTTVYRGLHGVIPIAPVVVLAAYAWSGSRGEGRRHALAVLVTIALAYALIGTLAIATMYLRDGRLVVGMEWGQRYLFVLYPILALLAVVGAVLHWRSARPLWLRRLFAAITVSMIFTGVGFQVRGQWMLNDNLANLARWEKAMRTEGPIVTDVWWLPAALAVFYTEHEMYYVSKRVQVADWAERAAAAGVTGFTFASLKPVHIEQFRSDALDLAAVQPDGIDGLRLTRVRIQETPAP